MELYTDIIGKNNSNGRVSLLDHTKEVLNMAMCIADGYFNECKPDLLTLAVILHDIGKCSTKFQKHIKSGKEMGVDNLELYRDKYHKHNIISWAFAYSCVGGMRRKEYRPVYTSVLYHHVVACDDQEKTTALKVITDLIANDREAYDKMCSFYKDMLGYADRTFGLTMSSEVNLSLIDGVDNFNGEHTKLSDIPLHPEVSDPTKYTNHNETGMDDYSNTQLIRSLLVYCDREVSSDRHDNLRILSNDTDYIRSIFEKHITTENFEPDYAVYEQDRLRVQTEIVDDIIRVDSNINVIPASAGFGKTLTGLIWFLKTGRKTLWVLPRNIIGSGTYKSVVDEISKMGIGDKVKVALFHTGKVQACNYTTCDECRIEDCNITVINIDGFLSYHSKNNLSTLLIDHYSKNVIIDEYHEMVDDAPLFSAYTNMLYTRMHRSSAKTLLLSATAVNLNPLLLGSEILSRRLPQYIHGGDVKVNIKVIDKSDFDINTVPDNSFVVAMTIPEAQEYARLSNKEYILIHSMYTKEDRKAKEEMLYTIYGKNAACGELKPMVIATSILGVGLDLSAKNLFDSPISPEDTIQRCCGRTSRFAEYGEVDYYVIVGKNGEHKRHINSVYDYELHKRWIAKLTEYNGKQITKYELYDIYNKFYDANRELYEEYLCRKYSNSSCALSGITLKPGNTPCETDEVFLPKGATYRNGKNRSDGVSGTVFVTVKTENGYMDPIAVEGYVFDGRGGIGVEDSSPSNNSARYDFLLKAIGKEGKKTLKHVYGINGPNYASVEKCARLAFSNKTPLLLCDFRYGKEYGLEFVGS